MRKTIFPARYQMRMLNLLIWGFGICLLTEIPSFAEPASPSFGYEDVEKNARLLAQKPFEETKKIPAFLSKLSFDQWRDIRFKPEKALWRDDKLPFQIQFVHPGFLYEHAVSMNVVESGEVKPIPFSPDLFHYGMNEFKEKVPKDLGFAGFRLHYPLNTSNYYDEVAVFLGASYFRAVGRKEHFGLSGRAVAIDTAMESGEEFPYFKEFWFVRPHKESGSITILALLDSPSLTGAYQFRIQPGKATLMNVEATLFLRKEVKKLGLAPLTSMFFYGENTNIRPVDDFRPEVHDSDGLLINGSTGEWIWRPLIDPKRLLVTSFQLNDPKGFGLFQQDLNFDHYQDLALDYQSRPSAWVIPEERFGGRTSGACADSHGQRP